mmetsp:Transcript_5804/g.12720  ORF Transcript_5804/g.12720 Transcript_5804/m.12720 type:complete len:85 (+) Transcript_5804:2834-3088(+)
MFAPQERDGCASKDGGWFLLTIFKLHGAVWAGSVKSSVREIQYGEEFVFGAYMACVFRAHMAPSYFCHVIQYVLHMTEYPRMCI